MTRYYKTRKDSETGKKITSILDRAKEFDEKAAILECKYGFEYSVHYSFYYRAIEGVRFNEEPDMDIWKREKNSCNIYSLRARCKDKTKKELFDKITSDLAEINKLSIKRREFDKAVGNKTINNVGLYFGKDYYLFYGADGIGGDLPEDCEEITNLEYLKLTEE